MNIFFLDYDTKKCAESHIDKHVVKMILEYAQLMSTAHRVLDGSENETLYKSTHMNHPCGIWIREDKANYDYVYSLFLDLCDEYRVRYGKTHLTETKLKDLLLEAPRNMPDNGMTWPAQAMPEEYRSEDPVDAYRAYYKGSKAEIATWKTKQPEWW
jgi:hypothetical protein